TAQPITNAESGLILRSTRCATSPAALSSWVVSADVSGASPRLRASPSIQLPIGPPRFASMSSIRTSMAQVELAIFAKIRKSRADRDSLNAQAEGELIDRNELDTASCSVGGPRCGPDSQTAPQRYRSGRPDLWKRRPDLPVWS